MGVEMWTSYQAFNMEGVMRMESALNSCPFIFFHIWLTDFFGLGVRPEDVLAKLSQSFRHFISSPQQMLNSVIYTDASDDSLETSW